MKAKMTEKVRSLLFHDGKGGIHPTGYSDWTNAELRRIRFWINEFVVNYRSEKLDGSVAPITMRTYIENVQRGLRLDWGYDLKLMKDPVFADPNEGVTAVMDNPFREQQSQGSYKKSHNDLTLKDLEKLYRSNGLSLETPQGLQTRMVFSVGLVTAMRPTSLLSLEAKQFTRRTVDEEEAWVITGVIGSENGASKTERGRLKAVCDKPIQIPVWRQLAFDGHLCVFDDIDYYMQLRRKKRVSTNRFFLDANLNAKRKQDFIRDQPLGINTFRKLVKNACSAEGITGNGPHDFVTTHSLSATVASLLCRSKHLGSSVAMRTGHRVVERSLRSYQNLFSDEGRQKQRDIFEPSNNSVMIKKRARVSKAQLHLMREAEDCYASTTLDGTGNMDCAEEGSKEKFSPVQVGSNKRQSHLPFVLQGVTGSLGNVSNSTINISIFLDRP